MPTDAELENISGRLHTFMVSSEEHHDTLQLLIQEHQNLVESYRQLKSDYEDEKIARRKYKKLAKAKVNPQVSSEVSPKEPNPFVLLLVDGNGYVFREGFLRADVEGGISAARTLSDSIKEVLIPRLGKDAEQYRVMVRVYANLAGLSRTLSRVGMARNESRSLAAFMSGFTSSQELFEFVDAGEGNGCSSKMKEMFRLYGESCKKSHAPLEKASTPSTPRESVPDTAPKPTLEHEGLIPVNKYEQRVDIFLPRPSNDSWEIYQLRTKIRKPCNQFHVVGKCQAVPCPFDHSPIELESINVMRYLMREIPCPDGSGCRSAQCYKGHICLKEDCTGGKPNHCRFKESAHVMESRVSAWLLSDQVQEAKRVSASDSSSE
ncbi:hypothetical protein FQN54_008894 [Arachnomyces sp. PD_36]|nr:hypothetical protein FQN54_008894 [Arachnomyces sp. PD_36]